MHCLAGQRNGSGHVGDWQIASGPKWPGPGDLAHNSPASGAGGQHSRTQGGPPAGVSDPASAVHGNSGGPAAHSRRPRDNRFATAAAAMHPDDLQLGSDDQEWTGVCDGARQARPDQPWPQPNQKQPVHLQPVQRFPAFAVGDVVRYTDRHPDGTTQDVSVLIEQVDIPGQQYGVRLPDAKNLRYTTQSRLQRIEQKSRAAVGTYAGGCVNKASHGIMQAAVAGTHAQSSAAGFVTTDDILQAAAPTVIKMTRPASTRQAATESSIPARRSTAATKPLHQAHAMATSMEYKCINGSRIQLTEDCMKRLAGPTPHQLNIAPANSTSAVHGDGRLNDDIVNIAGDIIMRQNHARATSQQHKRVFIFNTYFCTKLLGW